jgi:hypothetical protein
VLYTLPEDPRYRIRLVCLREDDLLSSKASVALKTAETSTHPLSCKMALGIRGVEGKERQKNSMQIKQMLFQVVSALL